MPVFCAIYVQCPPQVPRPANDASCPPICELGNIACTGLELKCDGFTEFFCQERVEYAWLMQLVVGRITGTVSTEQVHVAARFTYLSALFYYYLYH